MFQYLADVEMNATINDDLVNEVCHTAQLQSNYYENVLTLWLHAHTTTFEHFCFEVQGLKQCLKLEILSMIHVIETDHAFLWTNHNCA